MKPRLLALGATVLSVLVSGGTALRAGASTPLPDFELTTLDGTVVHSHSGLSNHQKWLIVYVQPNCRPCDTLLHLIKEDEHPELPARLVIIAGGLEAAEAARMRDKLPDLSGAQWYVDPAGKGWMALKMTGVPMVFGLRDRTIEWTLSGVLASGSQVKSILSSWAAE